MRGNNKKMKQSWNLSQEIEMKQVQSLNYIKQPEQELQLKAATSLHISNMSSF